MASINLHAALASHFATPPGRVQNVRNGDLEHGPYKPQLAARGSLPGAYFSHRAQCRSFLFWPGASLPLLRCLFLGTRPSVAKPTARPPAILVSSRSSAARGDAPGAAWECNIGLTAELTPHQS